MKKLDAWINWSEANQEWVLRLWNDKDGWVFSKAWPVKNQDENGMGWVHDSVLTEIAYLQDLGYEVKISAYLKGGKKMKWHKVEERPEKSCQVVCVMRNDYITTLSYSKLHNAFNVRDWDDEARVNEYSIKGVTYWAYLQDAMEEAIG